MRQAPDWQTDDGRVQLYCGDCLEILPMLEEGSVHCCVTSPPYWGLRDYGTGTWIGGDEFCKHQRERQGKNGKRANRSFTSPEVYKVTCKKCGAVRVDRQIGLESTPDEYVAKMVQVFSEVRRVLRDDGTLWLNLGDSYCGGGCGGNPEGSPFKKQATNVGSLIAPTKIPGGLKPKDLVGIPWRVAFALQRDGWYLRQDIIWNKPNPMPESVRDRCTKAHEYIFLLAKSQRYYYDADAIVEPAIYGGRIIDYTGTQKNNSADAVMQRTRPRGRKIVVANTRNRRSVWTINTEAFPEAHFATFPQALVEPCILASTSAEGACVECGCPYNRLVEKVRTFESGSGRSGNDPVGKHGVKLQGGGGTGDVRRGPCVHVTTNGWAPGCNCQSRMTEPCVVLDPFSGVGTTGVVAARFGRRYIGCELNPEYLDMSKRRIIEELDRTALLDRVREPREVQAKMFADREGER